MVNDQTNPNSPKKKRKKNQFHKSPFSEYFNLLSDIDKNQRYSQEYGSIMILSLVEEVGEMARAYLAEHGRKKTNLSAQQDESYEEELGDLLLTILRFARVKNINLHERLLYSLHKVQQRKLKPKDA
jgi:NTP pyrophosphatase (non-canonical NTP hydrolase)